MATQQLIADRIMQAHPYGHVMYEGALVSASGLGGKVTQATEETGCTVYAFLDTPENLCIERVKQRRLNAGNEKEFNPKNLIDKFNIKKIATIDFSNDIYNFNPNKTHKFFKDISSLIESLV